MEGVPQPEQPNGTETEHQIEAHKQKSGEGMPEVNPQIYVASLSDYNAGYLHGAWIEAGQEPVAIQEAIEQMLRASPTDPHAEEWAIHDFEGFNGLHLGEWEDLGYVSRVAQGIKAHGLAFAHWATLAATDDELGRFADAYLGHWPSIEAYAAEILEEAGVDRQLDTAVPEHLRPYVTLDAAGFGRDLELSGDVVASRAGDGVYLFSGSC